MEGAAGIAMYEHIRRGVIHLISNVFAIRKRLKRRIEALYRHALVVARMVEVDRFLGLPTIYLTLLLGGQLHHLSNTSLGQVCVRHKQGVDARAHGRRGEFDQLGI